MAFSGCSPCLALRPSKISTSSRVGSLLISSSVLGALLTAFRSSPRRFCVCELRDSRKNQICLQGLRWSYCSCLRLRLGFYRGLLSLYCFESLKFLIKMFRARYLLSGGSPRRNVFPIVPAFFLLVVFRKFEVVVFPPFDVIL